MKIMVTGVEHIEQLLLHHPPQIKGFNKDKLYYIIHKLYGTPFEIMDFSEGTELNASLLQDIIGNEYNQYLNYLMEHEVIVSNKQYKVGKHSRRYRLHPLLVGKPVWYEMKKKTLCQRIEKYGQSKPSVRTYEGMEDYIDNPNLLEHENNGIQPQQDYHYITKWLKELQIHAEEAENWATSYWVQKTLKPDYKDKVKYGKPYRNKPGVEYINRLKMIEYFKSDQRPYIIDGFGYRLHTTLTGCDRELRRFLHCKGEPLVAVDVKNCQPYLLTVLLDPEFWTNSVRLKQFNIENAGICFSSLYSIMILKMDKKKAKKGLELYKNLVQSGKLYEFLVDQIFPEFSNDTEYVKTDSEKRDMVKFQIMLYLYGEKNKHCKRIADTFKRHFPIAAEMIQFMKTEFPPKSIARILQRIESHIILECVCKELSDKHPDIPIFTIHDSILTTESNLMILESTMTTVLEQIVKIPPTVSIEFNSISKSMTKLEKLERVDEWEKNLNSQFGDDMQFLLA